MLDVNDGYTYKELWRKHSKLLKIDGAYPVHYKLDPNNTKKYIFNFEPSIDELTNGFFTIGFKLPFVIRLFKRDGITAKPLTLKNLNVLNGLLWNTVGDLHTDIISYIQKHFVTMYSEHGPNKKMIIIVEP